MGQSTSLSHAIEERDGKADKIGEVVQLRKIERAMSQKFEEKKAVLYIEALNDECLPIICAVDKFSEFLFGVQKVTSPESNADDRYSIKKKMKKHLDGEYLTQLVKLMDGVVHTVLDTQADGVVEENHTHVVYANMSVLRIDYYLYFTRFPFGEGKTAAKMTALFYYVQVGVIDMIRVRQPVLIYELTRATGKDQLGNAGEKLKEVADSSLRLHQAVETLANAARQAAGNPSSILGQPSSTNLLPEKLRSTGSSPGEPSSISSMAGTLLPAAELTLSVLEKVLQALGDINRKIAIGIANETPFSWEALNVFFESGTSDTILPEKVNTDQALTYSARKTAGPVATGSVGVVTYYMKGADKTLAVLFSVPFDYNLYSNWWDAKVYSGRKNADYDMYQEMYNGDPFKGDDAWHSKAIGEEFSMKGIMTSAGTCRQQLKIYK